MWLGLPASMAAPQDPVHGGQDFKSKKSQCSREMAESRWSLLSRFRHHTASLGHTLLGEAVSVLVASRGGCKECTSGWEGWVGAIFKPQTAREGSSV